jgi:hypothetical protein
MVLPFLLARALRELIRNLFKPPSLNGAYLSGILSFVRQIKAFTAHRIKVQKERRVGDIEVVKAMLKSKYFEAYARKMYAYSFHDLG